MKVSIIGYGKMGKEIEQLCIKRGHTIYSIVDPILNTNLDALIGADLAIEFTQPTVAELNIRFCLDHGIPVVSGTTGWHTELENLQEYCKSRNGTFFYSSNYSIGVHLFWQVSRFLSGTMDSFREYKLSIHEVHHDQKKDAPSGTAVTLAEEMLKASNRFSAWQKTDKQDWSAHDAIPISSGRVGAVPGIHSVEYKSDHDRLVFTHEAFTRGGFVTGVVMAAEWLIGKKGVFGMDDLFTRPTDQAQVNG